MKVVTLKTFISNKWILENNRNKPINPADMNGNEVSRGGWESWNLNRKHQTTTSTRLCEQPWLPQEANLVRQLLWELLGAVFFAATHPAALYLKTWTKRLSSSLILVLRWGISFCYNILMRHLWTSVIRNQHLTRAWERRWEYWELGEWCMHLVTDHLHRDPFTVRWSNWTSSSCHVHSHYSFSYLSLQRYWWILL